MKVGKRVLLLKLTGVSIMKAAAHQSLILTFQVTVSFFFLG